MQPSQKDQSIEVIYYTDPLCCWSWGFEPQWRRLRYEWGKQMTWRYCMGGLLSDWNNYNDGVNSISRPAQMGPLWFEAKQVTGMPFYDRIWMEDPPCTSYLACVAVKCSAKQSFLAEEKFLRYTREAVMLQGLNIARREVLVEIANKVENDNIGFDLSLFVKDFASHASLESFKDDLKEVRYKNIGRFPTLVIKGQNGRAALVTGYRNYDELFNAVKQVAATTKCVSTSIDIDEYKNYYGMLTHREIAEAISYKSKVSS